MMAYSEEEISKNVAAFLQRVVERYGNQTKAAGYAGIKQGHISAIIGGTKQPGMDAICRIANAQKVSISEVIGDVITAIEEDDAYPNRGAALARLRGLISEETRRMLLSRKNFRSDPPVQQWMMLALSNSALPSGEPDEGLPEDVAVFRKREKAKKASR